ncbi:hypothetical protein BDQ17DRAFT_1344506 [Cyathus striatus]|nr:hypothetical protein BDQ17DRAFT_1344506 [Cyathus striatus]
MFMGPIHDTEYYLDTVVFLVDNCLFKVPRYYLAQNSDIFRATFSLPCTGAVEGSSDDIPFKLEGINRDDFRNLMRVIYPKYPNNSDNLTPAEWISVLKLSTMWNFTDIRKRAIDELSTAKFDPVEKILLAKVHKIPSWLIGGYNELIRRRESISVEEATRLGTETTVGLFHIREEIAPTAEYYSYGHRAARENQNFTDNIKRKFQAELKEIEAASAAFASAIS